MTEADTKQKHVDLTAKKKQLSEELQAVTNEQKTSADKKDKLATTQTENDDLQKSIEELRAYNNKAEEEVNTFPSETMMLKLERQVESLKDQVKESEKLVSQHTTGIEAYSVRREETRKARLELVQNLCACVDSVVEIASKYAAAESSVQTGEHINNEAAERTFKAVCIGRESLLQDLHESAERLRAEEAEHTQAIKQLKQQQELELPRVDAEKERDILEITAEWQVEHDYLQGVYEKLLIVNKEQSYHLVRGTHVKQQPQKTQHLEESALSLQQSNLASSVYAFREQLKDAKNDRYFAERQLESAKEQGRGASAKYVREQDDADKRLADVMGRREDAEKEDRMLRNLKTELYQALQAVRESQASGVTPREVA